MTNHFLGRRERLQSRRLRRSQGEILGRYSSKGAEYAEEEGSVCGDRCLLILLGEWDEIPFI